MSMSMSMISGSVCLFLYTGPDLGQVYVYDFRVSLSFSLYWYSILLVSCFICSGALDKQLWCSNIILYNITSIVYNHPAY